MVDAFWGSITISSLAECQLFFTELQETLRVLHACDQVEFIAFISGIIDLFLVASVTVSPWEVGAIVSQVIPSAKVCLGADHSSTISILGMDTENSVVRWL